MSRMSERKKPKQRRLPAPIRREQVFDAALAMFAERGYTGTRMSDIAEAAGITRTVLYYYFPSKEQLFVEVLGAQVSALMGRIQPIITDADSSATRGRRVLESLLDFSQERPEAWRVLFEHRSDRGAEFARVRKVLDDSVTSASIALAAPELVAAGLDPHGPRVAVMNAAVQAAVLATARWWQEHPEVDRDVVVDAATDLLWRGGLSVLEAKTTQR